MADGSVTIKSEQGSILSIVPRTEFRLNEYLVYILTHKLLSIIGMHVPYIFLAQYDTDNHGKIEKGCSLRTVTIAVSTANSFPQLWFNINMLLNLKLKIWLCCLYHLYSITAFFCFNCFQMLVSLKSSFTRSSWNEITGLPIPKTPYYSSNFSPYHYKSWPHPLLSFILSH